ncbi:MAG: hypothetical protein VX191_01290 [Candidatus Thermoplasmatota archaeon]|nr:hypothetical protein [Candidatus Thermoplasmatota archaeon]
MEITQVLILLLHPIAALVVIREFARQRNWRKLSTSLKGSERSTQLEKHEVQGERLFRWVFVVITLAFAAKVASALISGEEFELGLLMPGHFHGWGGLLALALMTYLWSLGRKTSANKKARESFAKVKELHGRLSDVMMGLIAIHAFLGFLYLLQLIG